MRERQQSDPPGFIQRAVEPCADSVIRTALGDELAHCFGAAFLHRFVLLIAFPARNDEQVQVFEFAVAQILTDQQMQFQFRRKLDDSGQPDHAAARAAAVDIQSGSDDFLRRLNYGLRYGFRSGAAVGAQQGKYDGRTQKRGQQRVFEFPIHS